MLMSSIQFEIRFTSFDVDHPEYLRFDFIALSASIPSFHSLALAGGTTGDNVIVLCHHFPGVAGGWVNTQTGVATAGLEADLINDVFPPGQPAYRC